MWLFALLGKRPWLWLVLALAARAGSAQSVSPAAFRLVRPARRTVEVPFVTQRNLLIVAIRLNGHGPYSFMVDTGVSTSLITDPQLADSLHLPHTAEYRLAGVGGEDSGLRAYETPAVRVELPGVVAPRMTWLVLSSDVLNLSSYAGMPIRGILGSELFQSLVVGIDPHQNRLLLSNPARYRAPKGRRWATLPLRLDHGKAYLTAEVQQLPIAGRPTPPALPLQLVLDTGAGHALSLETTADPRLYIPPRHLRTDLGRGLSGLLSGYLGRVASLQLGRYTLAQVLTSFPDSTQVHLRLPANERFRQGNLGYEALKRFEAVIDYPHQRLLLRPAQSLREPFEHDMCGLELLATGNDFRRYLVQRVVPGSPAASAGVSAGEELLSINFLPVNSFNVNELHRLLHLRDGATLLLVFRRPDGELHPTNVCLKRQI